LAATAQQQGFGGFFAFSAKRVTKPQAAATGRRAQHWQRMDPDLVKLARYELS
jgi:hypothetical protein